MNDCIWIIVAHCECCGTSKCVHRLSMDSKKGLMIMGQYLQDVDNALEPVWKEWDRVRRQYKKDEV